MSDIVIRRAEAADLPALRDIYNYYVVATPITFDLEPRTLEDRQAWFAEFTNGGRHQCFAATVDGAPVGYACSHRFKEKAAYATSVSVSIYCAPGKTRKGIGRQLYGHLFGALQGEDIHRVHAGITLPNAASVGLHEAFGFRLIGMQHEVGRKFGKYWDVGLFEREF